MARPRSPVILIPARMKSVRLPGKPLADICGQPMIVQVWRRAVEAGLGPVCVAAAEPEIAEAVTKAGGNAVLTDPDHPSGSDRIFEALRKIDPGSRHDAIVNLQGDLPTIDPAMIRRETLAGAGPGAREIGDRAKAIQQAVAALRGGDALVLAGKGHEDYQIIGTEVVPFSDRAEAVKAARAIGGHAVGEAA